MAFNVGQGVLAYLPALGDYSDLYFNNSNHGENSDPGPGTIFADPMFTESYELRDGSPCINAGDTVKRYADPDGTASDMRALYHTCCFGTTRGNVDKYGESDLTDLSTLMLYLTVRSVTLDCRASADLSGDGLVDLVDLSRLIHYLTGTGGYSLPPCLPNLRCTELVMDRPVTRPRLED